MKKRKVLQKLLAGSKNLLPGREILRTATAAMKSKIWGFVLRMTDNLQFSVRPELVNLQNVKGKAKLYQIKKILNMVHQLRVLHLSGSKNTISKYFWAMLLTFCVILLF